MNRLVKTFDGLDHQYTLEEECLNQIVAHTFYTMEKQHLDHEKTATKGGIFKVLFI